MDSMQLSRRDILRTIGMGLTASALSPLATALEQAAQNNYNVLFIPVDDLRTELGCYGNTDVISPNIDKLAASGMTFNRAYCQQAICGPSRASVLSGCRPDTTKIYRIGGKVNENLPGITTLPGLFKKNGYFTASLGKVYHPASDDKESWDVLEKIKRGMYIGQKERAAMRQRIREAKKRGEKNITPYIRGTAWEAADLPDAKYEDGAMVNRAIQLLQQHKDQRFFIAAGLKKPHLPFVAPKKYWDLYDPSKIEIPPRTHPKAAPPLAFTNWSELRAYRNIPNKGDLDDQTTRTLIHGYHACVSFVDAQVGRLLGELKKLGLERKTVVMLWGDHGWKLGEYGDWSKQTNFELDTHAPLILRVPGMQGGRQCDALVEFVDMYPTLADTCGLAVPKHCEGASLVPLLSDPKRKWKKAAFSQYPRFRGKGKNRKNYMGYSMRCGKWRYVEWKDLSDNGKVVARELYDHSKSDIASANLVDRPEYAEVAKEMAAIMAAGWQGALPAR